MNISIRIFYVKEIPIDLAIIKEVLSWIESSENYTITFWYHAIEDADTEDGYKLAVHAILLGQIVRNKLNPLCYCTGIYKEKDRTTLYLPYPVAENYSMLINRKPLYQTLLKDLLK